MSQQDQKDDKNLRYTFQTAPYYAKVLWVAYFVVSLITFFYYVNCGVKTGSIGQVFVGIFLSGLWPLLLVYVLVKKYTDSKYRFCMKDIVLSVKK